MERYTMLDYVKEAPLVALNNINNYINVTESLYQYAKSIDYKRIILVASGSSYNACICARSFMIKYLKVDVRVISPYTFTYYEHDINDNDIVLVVSQSGLSTNAIEALLKIKSLNHYAICLTANPNSDVKDVADLVIDYHNGQELVGYVTKGVTCLCLYLMLFTIRISDQLFLLKELKKGIKLNEEMIDKTLDFIKIHYKELSSMAHTYSLGAASSYGIALESALKMGETIHIPSMAYEIEEYIHGPNLQLTPEYNIFIFDNNDLSKERVKQIYLASKAITSRVYMISNNEDFKDDDHVISLSDNLMMEILPLAYLPFVQIISFIISNDTHKVFQHPLLKEFKKIASAKTSSFVNYDNDD